MMFINAAADNKFNYIPSLKEEYTHPQSRKNTVTILGSATSSKALEEYMELCSEVTKTLVLNGKKILTGCGANGIMGSAYESAAKNSVRNLNGDRVQNLAIVVEPGWGDEDISRCVTIGKAKSESERIEKFFKCSDNFVIFPGGAGTMQETASIINLKMHKDENNLKKIVLVGKDFFEGLKKQYQTIFDFNPLRHLPPEKLFKILNSKEEIISAILKIKH